MAAEQLGLFGSPPARANTAVTAPPAEVCPHHGPEFMCSVCPGKLATDSTGFVHPSLLRGRLAMRVCNGCGRLRTVGQWNLADWWSCLECVPRGAISAEQRPVWEAIHRRPWEDSRDRAG
jgi:hypothetical protein